MLKKFYLSKSEIELIQIALGEMVISEKKKEKDFFRSLSSYFFNYASKQSPTLSL